MEDRALDGGVVAELSGLLERSSCGVVVFERLPRAAGQTRWFFCDSPGALSQVIGLLSPASRVSFYFDGRISEQPVNHAASRIARIFATHGEVVVARLLDDGPELDVELISSADEVEDLLSISGDASRAFVGSFPAPDDDGVDAVTVIVPDADGTVRREPH